MRNFSILSDLRRYVGYKRLTASEFRVSRALSAVYHRIAMFLSRDSPVGIATRYGLDGP